MPDYTYRSEVLASGLVKEVKNLNKKIYLSTKNIDEESFNSFVFERTLLEAEDMDAFAEALKIIRADHMRCNRLRKRIYDIIERGDAVFLTLTFTDEVLNKTNEKTRRQYVTKYLKTQSMYYCANIDWGSRTEREHYHAVVGSHIDMSAWKFGFSFVERINSADDSLRLAHYVNKLVNHSIKESTRRNYIIYSRPTFEKRMKDKVGLRLH